jgi:NADPH-dependent 2,4-dienoyl-CoA reductase/sulfur reductase-like enzyme
MISTGANHLQSAKTRFHVPGTRPVASVPSAEVLDGVHECDVAVIGSGIAGISTAYELSKRRKSVIVIDRGRIPFWRSHME